jgi:hypothetical protein
MMRAWHTIVSMALLAAGPVSAQVVVQPGADLEAAIVAGRGGPRPLVVELAAGRHVLRRPLVLTAADSGLTLQGPGSGDAIVVGAVSLDVWKPVAGQDGLFEAPLPEALRTRPPRHLFRDGRMLPRARTPNAGWLESPGVLATQPPFTLAIPSRHPVAGWELDDGIWIVGLQKWSGFRLPVHGIDAAANAIRLDGTLPKDRQEKLNRFWIENDPAAVDVAGEWRVDPVRGMVQLLCAAGQPPPAGSVTAPMMSELVRLEGCRDVTVRKIRFREADDDLPAVGEVDVQAAIARRGAVRLVAARNVTIDACEFTAVGGYAIDLGRGSQECRVTRCELSHLGAGGVRIGETSVEREPAAEVGRHVVEGCRIHDYGRSHRAAVGLIVLQAAHNRLTDNEIHHGGYTAVSVGWTWGYEDSPCHHNLVEGNHLHHVGDDHLSDMGGVYLLGPQPGTVVRRNRIHDIACHDYGGWGLYTDEGSSGILLEENVVWNCQSAGFHQHYGRDNTVRSNLIVDCGEGGVRRSRDEPHRSFTFERNVVVCRTPRFVSGNWKHGDTVLRDNLYFSPAKEAASWNGISFADWQAAGHDAGSRFADPMLVDAARPDLGLRADSPAFAMGIRIPAVASAGPGVPPRADVSGD